MEVVCCTWKEVGLLFVFHFLNNDRVSSVNYHHYLCTQCHSVPESLNQNNEKKRCDDVMVLGVGGVLSDQLPSKVIENRGYCFG